MVVRYDVKGFEEFEEKVKPLDKSSDVFIFFSGSADKHSGKSWCPDCNVAKPVVVDAMDKLGEDAVFIYVEVGERQFWKDKKCIFRTSPLTKLTCVPTLLKLGSQKRLEESECANKELVEMLFEE